VPGLRSGQQQLGTRTQQLIQRHPYASLTPSVIFGLFEAPGNGTEHTQDLSDRADSHAATMPRSDKALKEAFVSNLTGSSVSDINAVTLVAPVGHLAPHFSEFDGR